MNLISDAIGFSEDVPEPAYIAADDLVEAMSLLEDFPFSEDFRDLAVESAKLNSTPTARTSVAFYSCSRPFESTLRKIPGDLVFIGTFPIQDPPEEADEEIESLHAAVAAQAWSRVGKMLKEGESIDTPNREGETVLYQACKRGNLEAVKKLLALGADVEAPTTLGHTPLMVAATTENIELAKLLMAAGASVQSETLDTGFTALDWILLHSPRDEKRVLLLVELLVKAGANVNHVSATGSTPLLQAAWFGNDKVIPLLINAGADAAATDPQGRTPAMLAKDRGHRRVIERLAYAPGKSGPHHNFLKRLLRKRPKS